MYVLRINNFSPKSMGVSGAWYKQVTPQSLYSLLTAARAILSSVLGIAFSGMSCMSGVVWWLGGVMWC